MPAKLLPRQPHGHRRKTCERTPILDFQCVRAQHVLTTSVHARETARLHVMADIDAQRVRADCLDDGCIRVCVLASVRASLSQLPGHRIVRAHHMVDGHRRNACRPGPARPSPGRLRPASLDVRACACTRLRACTPAQLRAHRGGHTKVDIDATTLERGGSSSSSSSSSSSNVFIRPTRHHRSCSLEREAGVAGCVLSSSGGDSSSHRCRHSRW